VKVVRYEFNLVVAGYGESVDEAFSNVLDSLKEDPEAAIINEVVYVVTNDEELQDETAI
tara:strand:+ start:949 stop:1125 length:177 start_codon:yes stop_codon:yes gene_type:complete